MASESLTDDERLIEEQERNYEVAWEIAHAINASKVMRVRLETEIEQLEQVSTIPGVSVDGVKEMLEDQFAREEEFESSLEEIAEVALPDQEGYDSTTDIWL